MLRFDGELPFGGSDDVAQGRKTGDVVQQLLGYDDDDLPVADEIDEAGAEVWQIAPEASHVDSFRFLDADPAEIHVRFKPTATQPMSEYVYTFPPGMRDHARIVYEEMVPVDHPGIVIWHWLIRGGIPYKRVA